MGRPCRRSVECEGTQRTPSSADLIVDILVRYEMHLGKSLVVPGVTRDFTYSSGWSRTGQGNDRDEPDEHRKEAAERDEPQAEDSVLRTWPVTVQCRLSAPPGRKRPAVLRQAVAA